MAKKTSKAKAQPTDPKLEVLKMLTPEQKDKLILKLFRKDPMLVEKLVFEFFEDRGDLRQRVDVIRAQIDEHIHPSSVYWMTPGELMMHMRAISGRISEHVKVTKDKYGEVELTIYLLKTAFTRFEKMLNDKWARADTFSEYVVKKTTAVLKTLDKLHEDNYLDFEDDLDFIFQFLHAYKRTSAAALAAGIPRKWRR